MMTQEEEIRFIRSRLVIIQERFEKLWAVVIGIVFWLLLVTVAVMIISTNKALAQPMSEKVWLAKDIMLHESIYVKADTMTVNQAFDYLQLLASGRLWFVNRYVIKNDTVYLRYGITLTPKRTYIVIHKFKKKHVRL